jgi:hypothetical protein
MKAKITQITEKKFEAKIEGLNETITGSKRAVIRRAKVQMNYIQNEIDGIDEKTRYDKAEKKICRRCMGEGYINHFMHVARGICYKCGGDGKVEKSPKLIGDNYTLYLNSDDEIEAQFNLTIDDAREEFKIAKGQCWKNWELRLNNASFKDGKF